MERRFAPLQFPLRRHADGLVERRHRPLRRLVVVAVAAVAAVALVAGPAAAGGWAATALDPLPSPQAGEPMEVGFTIRQHGVRPVNPQEPVGLVVTEASGASSFFPAQPTGPTGHFVAEVTFTEPGRASWTARQGEFGNYDLGTVEVGTAAAVPVAQGGMAEGTGTAAEAAATDGGGATTTAAGWWSWARIGLPVAAAAFVGAAAMELAVGRRHRRPTPADHSAGGAPA